MTAHATSATEVLSLVDNVVGRLSSACEEGNRLRDFPPDFSLSILKDLDTKLHVGLSYVKTIRNSFVPINRIPIELVGYILSLTVERIPNFEPTLPRDPYYGTVQELDWPYRHFAKATQVCRYWRAITTQFAHNWNTIQIYSKSRRIETDGFTSMCSQYASLCLTRAASSPLDIALYNKPSSVWWEGNLLAQMHRFRKLVIDDTDVLPQLCLPAPYLRSLTIEPTWRTGGTRPPAQIPQLFAGQAPSLRYLSIRYFVPWPMNTFPDLTHLCLQGDGTSSPYNLAQCMSFLSTTPKLEELIFAFVESVTNDIPDHRVTLPHLRRLVFYNCGPNVVSQTLSYLTLPPKSILSVRFQRHGGWRPDRDPDYFACLPEDHPRVVEPLALTKFCFVQDDSHTSWLRLIGCSGAAGGSAFDLYPGLVVGGLGRGVLTNNVVRLLSSCPIEELWTSPVKASSRLTVSSPHPTLDPTVWRQLFLAMPGLRRLVLGEWKRYGSEPFDDGCIPALKSGAEELCPQLAELFLIGDWSPRSVCQLAKERAAVGRPLQRVVIRRRPEDATKTSIADMGWIKGGFGPQAWSKASLDLLREVVPVVEFTEFEDFATSLPDICFQTRHAYWPSWKNQNTL